MARKKCIIKLWDASGPGRGRGFVTGIIQDAESVQVTEYVNAGGSLSFIIPYDHPQAAAIVPHRTHFEVTRYAEDGSKRVIAVGLIVDYKSDKDTTTVYGELYLNGLSYSDTKAGSIGGLSVTTYLDKFIGEILTDTISACISEPNSRLGFLKLGTIDTTSQSVPKVVSAAQDRLQLVQNAISIWQADQSVRPWLRVSREAPFTIDFTENAGEEYLRDYPVVFGRNLANYLFAPGWKEVRTFVQSVGWMRGSSDIFYTSQTYGDESLTGHLAFPTLHYNVADQTALDGLARHDVRVANQTPKNLSIVMEEGIPPFDGGWELLDNIPVTIDRGVLTQLDRYLFTIVGFTWNFSGTREQTSIATIPKQNQNPPYSADITDDYNRGDSQYGDSPGVGYTKSGDSNVVNGQLILTDGQYASVEVTTS